MKNFRLIADGYAVAASLAEIASRPEMWREDSARPTYLGSKPHHTDVIHLRVPTATTPEAILEASEAVDNPATISRLPVTSALIDRVLTAAGARTLGRVMIVNLKPGGRIDPHIDHGAYAAFFDRYHLVLDSAPGNVFHCGDELVRMRTGEFWQFNHHIEHTVLNRSAMNRYHVIIDALIPRKWGD